MSNHKGGVGGARQCYGVQWCSAVLVCIVWCASWDSAIDVVMWIHPDKSLPRQNPTKSVPFGVNYCCSIRPKYVVEQGFGSAHTGFHTK